MNSLNMSTYMQMIHMSRYARWDESKGRRELWEETVQRYINFWSDRGDLDKKTQKLLFEAIHDLKVMPSMRCLMTAGPALDRDNVAGFNCSYLAVDDKRSFDELMYILMCGTGVGFSVERQYINKLPTVAEEFRDTDTVISVADSKIGWATALKELISLLYEGSIPSWDTSKVRPAGAKLKTFGGRASGPDPLVELFEFTVNLFKGAAGRKLNSLECHDLCCKIADIVVVGGVRRSALISLSNVSDDRMRHAKTGQWWEENSQRALANNSAAYTEKPDFDTFLREWIALYESKSGERGILSRPAMQKKALESGRREWNYDFGTNPCSEIILRPNQFCNLSEVVVRADDSLEQLIEKVKLATILGTLQSSLTDFRYLRKVWQRNTEEEALLGVSLTGIMDHPILNGTHEKSNELDSWLTVLKEVAVETNTFWAKQLGVQPSVAITCVKPSGTVSQLVNSASGIHARFAPYYIRRVRADKKDPLAQFMKDKGIPCEEDVLNDKVYVFSFPEKAPDGAVCTKDMTAEQQLNHWLTYYRSWCEHKPSITIYYKDSEFLSLGQKVFNNFDEISGISFLPYSDHTYKQAPYEEITADVYEGLASELPELDWNEFFAYEEEDNTKGTQELACTGSVCEMKEL